MANLSGKVNGARRGSFRRFWLWLAPIDCMKRDPSRRKPGGLPDPKYRQMNTVVHPQQTVIKKSRASIRHRNPGKKNKR
jgi:hypothetical protein